jgi:hypothetical protein
MVLARKASLRRGHTDTARGSEPMSGEPGAFDD